MNHCHWLTCAVCLFLGYLQPIYANTTYDLPALEYYDCASETLEEVNIDFVEGDTLNVKDKKASTQFLQGGKIEVVINDLGQFLGLKVKSKESHPHTANELFLSSDKLHSKYFFVANEIKKDSFIRGFNMPVFSFGYCEDQRETSEHGVCIELGYLNNIRVRDAIVDIFGAVFKKWLVGLFFTTDFNSVQENYDYILTHEPQRWSTKQVFADWSSGKVKTYSLNDDGLMEATNLIIGKLKTRSGMFQGLKELDGVWVEAHPVTNELNQPVVYSHLNQQNCQM